MARSWQPVFRQAVSVMWVVRINSTPPQDMTLRKVITVGRHIDNDVIVGGERIADHHARIETDERGSRLVPVEGRVAIEVNGAPLSVPFGLKPGDEITIGDASMSIVDDGAESAIARASSIRWELEGEKGELVDEHVALNRITTVGRSDDCDVVLKEGHISRTHARLHPIADEVYLEDLGSANGTYLNGQRIWGAIRLHHGDHVRFDETSFRVYGKTTTVESGATVIRPGELQGEEPAAAPGLDGDPIAPTRVIDPSATVENPRVPTAIGNARDVADRETGRDLDTVQQMEKLASDSIENPFDSALAETSVMDLSDMKQAMTDDGEAEDAESRGVPADKEDVPLLKTVVIAPELPTVTGGDQIPPTMVLEAGRLPPEDAGRLPPEEAGRLPPEKDEATEALTVEGDLPHLLGLTAPVVGDMLSLRQGRMTLGRATDCDLVVSEPSVSSRHAQVIVNASGVTLMNLFSANGTFVNGEPIDTVKLKPGDVIQMGRVEFLFEPDQKMLAQRKGLPSWIYVLIGFGIVAAMLGIVIFV